MRLLPNKIKEIANSKGIKIKTILESTGLSKSFFYDVVNGNCSISLENAKKIGGVLGVSLDEMFPDENLKSEREVK